MCECEREREREREIKRERGYRDRNIEKIDFHTQLSKARILAGFFTAWREEWTS